MSSVSSISTVSASGQVHEFDPSEFVLGTQVRWKDVSNANVKELCRSYEQQGQQTPCRHVYNKDGKPVIIYGFTRLKAAELFNKLHPDTPMKLKSVFDEGYDEQKSIMAAIAENIQRNQMSPMDDAYAQQLIRDKYKWNDVQIAEFWGCSKGSISQKKALLGLDKKLQHLVHCGSLTVMQAWEARRMTVEEQLHYLKELEASGKLFEIEEGHFVKGNKKKPGEGGGNGSTLMTSKELTGMLKSMKDNDMLPESVHSVLTAIMLYLNKTIKCQEFQERLKNACKTD